MMSLNRWALSGLAAWCLVCQVGKADEFVEMGEYVSGAAVFGGKRGHFAGNGQNMVFKDSKGNVVWSTQGGWLNGANGQVTSEQAARIREKFREQKQREDREVQEGRRNPGYGSGPTTYHGYAGYWSGDNQRSVFVSTEYGIIYSSNGGWVDGFGPEYEPVRSKWGVGISDEANVYGDISDPNTVRRVSALKPNELYMVVEERRRFVTVAYEAAGRIVLADHPLTTGTIVPGSMIGKGGGKYKFVSLPNGFRFDPQ